MKVRVGAKLIVENPTDEVRRWCNANLIVDNPDYYKKLYMGKYVGNIPPKIVLYEKVSNELWLPFGCLRDLWKMHPDASAWSNEIVDLRRIKYESNIKPYEYQERAILSALRAKNGILIMPCGSGKTQCGLEVISRVGGRALWLTHTQDLLNQSKRRAESVLGYIGEGAITAGKVNIGEGITFATVQTLCKLDLSRYKDIWDIIIVDECQHCCGSPTKVTQFYKVVSSLSARYKIGLTATPKRADKLEIGMFALLGGVIHEVDKQEVAHTTCPVKTIQVHTNWFPDCECILMSDGTIDYSKVIDNMIHDENRFQVVWSAIAGLYHAGAILVLANRVEYLQRLCDAYNAGQAGRAMCLSGMSASKKSKVERKRALEALNNGELDCIFATYQLAKEGLDVPNLRYVIFATPEKDETTIVQSVGRVGRKAEGKEYGTVIDFIDDFGMYKKWAKEREKFYKKIDVEII